MTSKHLYLIPLVCRQALKGEAPPRVVRKLLSRARQEWHQMRQERSERHLRWSGLHLTREDLLSLRRAVHWSRLEEDRVDEALSSLEAWLAEGRPDHLLRAGCSWDSAERLWRSYRRELLHLAPRLADQEVWAGRTGGQQAG
jgi:hypothetical protein